MFLAQFVVHMPLCLHGVFWVCMACFVSQILCIVIRGARELSIGVCSLGAARRYRRAQAITMQGGEGVQLVWESCQ